jgi:hypothetical protein
MHKYKMCHKKLFPEEDLIKMRLTKEKKIIYLYTIIHL